MNCKESGVVENGSGFQDKETRFTKSKRYLVEG